ncbi:thermonuclease (plasmid) [Alkalihalophilus pseudofirmus OF4]|uniref:Thermonuclease n=1 Tax=Alkalihalophilus pseudofirmus (strain ATCC BAA-2126 / JCM 17055 / OF4) TaxID=398511 RepID=D3G1M9_ALKPO|nr:thermonuclease family protein [Alkalihalophilus pseudofirmus]ADC52255.1 thermonuclease [Alkalihalophilus pseudofirmus OF4]
MKKSFVLLATLLFIAGCDGENTLMTEEFKDLLDQGSPVIEEVVNDVTGNFNVESIIDAAVESISNTLEDQEVKLDSETSEDIESIAYGKVSNIVDGDTLDVILEEGNEERVRMLMVDTPETVKPGLKEPEPYGPEATEFAKAILTDQRVKLEFDKERYDRYGRTLAYVYLDSGEMYNEMLLAEGLAHVVVFKPNNKYEQRFREIEKAAQDARIGIWSIQ